MKAQEKEASQRDTSISQKECCAGKHKTFSPLRNPPSRDNVEDCSLDEVNAAEKIYISLLQAERVKDGEEIDNKSPFVVGRCNETAVLQRDKGSVEDGEERESQDIYNFSVDEHKKKQTYSDLFGERRSSRILKRRRGSYRKHAVTERIALFLEEFEEYFGLGFKLHKTELEYWIERLQLANDRVTVKQYLKRFLRDGYFRTERGVLVFQSKQPRQPTLKEILNVQRQIQTLRAVTHKPRRRRSY